MSKICIYKTDQKCSILTEPHSTIAVLWGRVSCPVALTESPVGPVGRSNRCAALQPLAPGWMLLTSLLLVWWRLARRLQLSPWESSVVNRLLTPTHSFLARSKSTAALSGDSGKMITVYFSWRGKVLLLKPVWATNGPQKYRFPFLPHCLLLSSLGGMALQVCLLVLVCWLPWCFLLLAFILASYVDARCQADKGCLPHDQMAPDSSVIHLIHYQKHLSHTCFSFCLCRCDQKEKEVNIY